MEKYNLIEKLLEMLPKIKVGNKLVTHLEVPSTHFGDRHVFDVVQDKAGNILGIRDELYNEFGKKITVDKWTPKVWSVTYFRDNGVRDFRLYDAEQKGFDRIKGMIPYLDYNKSGVNPVLYGK